MNLKVRIGFGLGAAASSDAARFLHIVDRGEELGFDSLWMSERISATTPDPMIALAVAAGRTTKMKIGTSVIVLPGRNPVLLAKEMATLDVLSNGRFLPGVGLGAIDPVEQQAFGVERKQRGALHDEALKVMRLCWTGEPFSFHGQFFHYDDVCVLPKPQQPTFDVWLGGIAESELRRVGRMGDGWMPSFCSPEDVAHGIDVITAVAAQEHRSIDPEHYGVLVAYCDTELPPRIAESIQRRRPGVDPHSVIPRRNDLGQLINEFISAGASKFIVVPLNAAFDPDAELGQLAEQLLPLET